MRAERTARETFEWAHRMAIEAEQAGFKEMMVAEHATQAWECIPNPELVIAAAALDTERIKFAPMAHLLPYHNPVTLAIQVGWLSQILEGRYFLGIGAGAYPNDAILRGLPDDMSENAERVREAMHVMELTWQASGDRKPFHYEGKYYKAGWPEEEAGSSYQAGGADLEADEEHLIADFRPWGTGEDLGPPQGPPGGRRAKLEIAVTGLSKNSPSMKFAGERGFIPVSIYSGASFLKTHWDTYAAAALANGHTPDRSRYHVSQDVFVADTDAEAKRRAMGGGLGYCWEKYLWPIFNRFGLLEGFIADKGATAADVDLEWIADNVWVCGSPETCVRKINELFEFTGGWGTLQVQSHDYYDDPAPWIESMNRIVKEVAPHIKLPQTASTAAG
jgi:alkanesulfonate monooxygenase SsuD/methylene tetrahydromethanopterin reductase-like flavin-dependent oxidoreductase (luciferase family)